MTYQRISETQYPAGRRGVVLIAVLLVIALLALASYQYAEVMTSEYKAADTAARAAQARAAAASGVYYAVCMLSDPNTFSGTLNSNPYDNDQSFHGIALGDPDRAGRQARFSLVAPQSVDDAISGSTDFYYGMESEHSKINPNAIMLLDPSGTTLYNMLMLLPNMTDDIASAIIDWIDPDDNPYGDAGAESDTYSAMGYQCKNGPLDTLEELLLVVGMTPELLFGIDKNRNGMPDPEETSSGEPFDRGWSAYLTVYSREINVDSTNTPRININDTTIDADTLHANLLDALGDETVVDFILAYRVNGAYSAAAAGGGGAGGGTTQVINSGSLITYAQLGSDPTMKSTIPSLYALVNAQVGVTAQGTAQAVAAPAATGGRGGGAAIVIAATPVSVTTLYNSPLTDEGLQESILPILLDKCTTTSATEIPARINVLTASQEVLTCLPGLQDTDVDNIMMVRPTLDSGELTDPQYQTTAWLLTQAQLSASTLQSLEKYITSSSQVYRVQSIGYFDKGGPSARVEAVVDTNGGKPRIVYWRSLSDLGRGFEIPK